MHRVAADRGIDTPAGRHGAPHERDVFLLDLAIVKLARQLLVGDVVFRHDHHARRSAIQPVHDENLCISAQRGINRLGPFRFGRHREQPGRFVHYDQAAIFKNDFDSFDDFHGEPSL